MRSGSFLARHGGLLALMIAAEVVMTLCALFFCLMVMRLRADLVDHILAALAQVTSLAR